MHGFFFELIQETLGTIVTILCVWPNSLLVLVNTDTEGEAVIGTAYLRDHFDELRKSFGDLAGEEREALKWRGRRTCYFDL